MSNHFSVAAYLQVEVDSKTGLFMAAGMLIIGGMILLPLSIVNILTPKHYIIPDKKEPVAAIGYSSYYATYM